MLPTEMTVESANSAFGHCGMIAFFPSPLVVYGLGKSGKESLCCSRPFKSPIQAASDTFH